MREQQSHAPHHTGALEQHEVCHHPVFPRRCSLPGNSEKVSPRSSTAQVWSGTFVFEFKSRKSRVALLYVSFKLPLTKCYISLNSCLFARYSFLNILKIFKYLEILFL